MPWNTNEAGKRLRECIGHSKHSLPTTQEMTLHMDIARWSIPKSDWLYSLQLKRSSIQPAKTRLGADYGTDHELFMPKLKLQLKKVGKTTRPFRYDLNQILYDYTAEVTKRSRDYIWVTESLKNYGNRFIILYKRPLTKPFQRTKKIARKQSNCLRKL